MTDTIKVRRKRLGSHFRGEVNSHKHILIGVVVFVSDRLVVIGREPLTDCGQFGRKLGGA
jgi:hypothetical protein